jgi:hypothetical protein
MDVSDRVRCEVRARFDAEIQAEVLGRLRTTPLPFLDAPDRWRDRDRVHLAILKIANGDTRRLQAALHQAAQDWRDVLVAAGLANADWPDVLRQAGFPVP